MIAPARRRVGRPARAATTLRGESVRAAEGDLTARMVSMNNVHRALPLTGALGFAVAFTREEAWVRPYRIGRCRP